MMLEACSEDEFKYYCCGYLAQVPCSIEEVEQVSSHPMGSLVPWHGGLELHRGGSVLASGLHMDNLRDVLTGFGRG
jgi:hypothetical protein